MLNIGRILQLQNMTGAPMDQMQTPPQMPGNLLTDMPQPQGGIQNVSGGVNTQTDPSMPPAQTFQPVHVAQDKYRDLLNAAPDRAIDDKPSVLRRIGGAIVGLGNGGEAGSNFTHEKFNNDMTDFSNKAKILGTAAGEEDKSNVTDRIAFDNDAKRSLDASKADDLRAKNEASLKIAQSKADTAAANAQTWQKRAGTYAEMAKGGTLQFDKAGNGQMVYKDGSVKPVDLSHFTPEELAEFKGAQDRKTAEVKSTATDNKPKWSLHQPLDENGKPVGDPVRIDMNTGKSEPVKIGGSLVKPPSPDSQNKSQILNYQSFVNAPNVAEQFKAIGKQPHDFFKTDPTSGSVVGLKDRKDFKDPNDLKLYDYIYNYFNKGKGEVKK